MAGSATCRHLQKGASIRGKGLRHRLASWITGSRHPQTKPSGSRGASPSPVTLTELLPLRVHRVGTVGPRRIQTPQSERQSDPWRVPQGLLWKKHCCTRPLSGQVTTRKVNCQEILQDKMSLHGPHCLREPLPPGATVPPAGRWCFARLWASVVPVSGAGAAPSPKGSGGGGHFWGNDKCPRKTGWPDSKACFGQRSWGFVGSEISSRTW